MRLAIALLLATSLWAQPRPISETERQAVSVVAAYLAHGPEAVYERLADDAPLRALPREDALREIAVRMGPREGATWTLRTADRDAAFQVAWPRGYEDGLLLRMRGDRVREIRALAEGERRPEAAPSPPAWPIPAAIALAVLGAAIIARWKLVGVMLLALATASAIVAYRERAQAPPLPFVELRELAPLREALARGRDAKIPADLPQDARDVATLWMLQSGAAVEVGGTNDDPIASLASVAKTPLAEILRARIALGDADEDAAARAFTRASSVPPLRDDILYEAAFSFGDRRADEFLARMHTLGSRDAETYYRAKTYDALKVAWTLEPKPREELLRSGHLDDVRAKALVSFFAATEPVRRSANLGRHALAWPAGAKAFVTGELLRVELGRAVLEVPNGAALAPPDAQLVPATHNARRRDAGALREAEELLAQGGTASRTRMVRAAKALAQRNRWADIVKLTDALHDDAPEELLVLRLHALLRTDRVEDAKQLADSKRVRALEGDARAAVDMRMRQLAMRRRFAATAQTIATPHFDIRHDPSINAAIASRIGDLLEAELARVMQKLPPFEPRRIAVNVLRWEEFRGEITRSDHILGLYDGEIFYPFAAVEQFKPQVVAILTHELTHALLAQVTHDRAPRWFQEGVAMRMELLGHDNAFTETPPGLVLPVPLLDATMEKNADPSAYVVAQTFIRFLEDRYGPGAIAEIATSFARGDDRVLGKSLDALNVEFRQWGFHHNGEFPMDQPWPYDALYSPDIDPRIRAGFRMGN